MANLATIQEKVWLMRQNQQYTDLVLKCSDGEISAHKAILALLLKFLGCDQEDLHEMDYILLPEETKDVVEKALEDFYLTSKSIYLHNIFSNKNQESESEDDLTFVGISPDQIQNEEEEDDCIIEEYVSADEDALNCNEEDLYKYGIYPTHDYDAQIQTHSSNNFQQFLPNLKMSLPHLGTAFNPPLLDKIPEVPKHYDCPQCDYTSHSMQNLKTHIETKHEGKRYYCDKCKFSAPYISGLRRHVKRVHEGVTYKCEFCEHKASTKFGLRIHRDAKHFGIKYSCDECNYQASQRGSLKIHIERRHKNKKARKTKKIKKQEQN